MKTTPLGNDNPSDRGMNTERREFFRVKGEIFLHYRKITEEERHRIISEIQKQQALLPADLSSEGNDLKYAFSLLSEAEATVLYDMHTRLIRIEDKLDKLASKLTKDANERDRPAFFESRGLNISGSGIALFTDECLNAGDYLEITFVLPLIPTYSIRALGSVVYSKASEEKEEDAPTGLFETGVHFLTLLEKDREQIVRYAFQQQSQEIRAKKEMEEI